MHPMLSPMNYAIRQHQILTVITEREYRHHFVDPAWQTASEQAPDNYDLCLMPTTGHRTVQVAIDWLNGRYA